MISFWGKEIILMEIEKGLEIIALEEKPFLLLEYYLVKIT
jgi:hypothetical protein